jgi:hypothetical protein
MKRIWNWLADRLIARAQRAPYFHLEGYMNRWWLFKTRWISARIHEVLRSDLDRHLHDHPWWNISIVLRGGYHEVMPRCKIPHFGYPARPGVEWCRVKWRGPGSIVFRRATSRHRLELPTGQTSWSLFIMGPRVQTWGFYTESGKVSWREYETTKDKIPEVEAHWGKAS